MAKQQEKEQEQGLPEFEGLSVVGAKVRITRAGDGLSEALTLAPRALMQNEPVFFVLKGRVSQVIHRPIGKDEPDLLSRVHVVEAMEVVQVSEADVDVLLIKEKDRLARLRAEQAGLEELPFDGEEGEEEDPF